MRRESGRLVVHFHRRLSEETGHPALREHLSGVIALMKVSPSWPRFTKALDIAYPRFGDTMEFPFLED